MFSKSLLKPLLTLSLAALGSAQALAQEPLSPLSSASSSSSTSSQSSTASLQCEVVNESLWSSGFVYSFAVTNTGSQPTDGWEVRVVMPDSATINNTWNANLSGAAPEYQAANKSWNNVIVSGQSAQFGVQGALAGPPDGEPLCFALGEDPRAQVQKTMQGQTAFVDALGFIQSLDNPQSVEIHWGDGHSVYGAHEAWHTYFFAGTYTITVEVTTDTGVEYESVSVEARAWSPQGNHAPVAMLAPYHSPGRVSLGSIIADADGDDLEEVTYEVNSAFASSASSSSSSQAVNNSSSSSFAPSYVSRVMTVSDGELGDTVQASGRAFNGYVDFPGVPRPLFRKSGLSLQVDAGHSTRSHYVWWDFGDGNDSYDAVATHTYAEPGQYDVTLYAQGMGFVDSKTVSVTVGMAENMPPSANFSCEVFELQVNCFPASEYDSDGDVLKFEWAMGDGRQLVRTSIYERVTHQYDAPGQYEIHLSVFDGTQRTEHSATVVVPPIEEN